MLATASIPREKGLTVPTFECDCGVEIFWAGQNIAESVCSNLVLSLSISTNILNMMSIPEIQKRIIL